MAKNQRRRQKEKLIKTAEKAIAWNDYKFALHAVDQLIELDPGDIAGYLFKVKILLESGKIEDAKDSMMFVLKLAKQKWREKQISHEYYIIEEMESFLDGLSDKETAAQRKNERFLEYAEGLLYFIGAVPFPVLKTLVEDIVDLRIDLNQSEFANLVENDQRFKTQGKRPMIVSLPQVADPKKLVREFDERSLDYAEFTIDELVDSREVWAELFFDEPELQALERLREITQSNIDVEQLHMLLNQAEKSPVEVVEKIGGMIGIYKTIDQAQEVAEIIMQLWNNWPRWELGGNTPEEIMDMERGFLRELGEDEDEDSDIWDDDWEDHKQEPVRVEKIGRNQPCPCGGGKKYKKCCGK